MGLCVGFMSNMSVVKMWNTNQPRLMMQNSEKGGGNGMISE
jgi:hypothetical protein